LLYKLILICLFRQGKFLHGDRRPSMAIGAVQVRTAALHRRCLNLHRLRIMLTFGSLSTERSNSMARWLMTSKATAILVLLALPLLAPPALAATPDPWPKRFEDPKGAVVMYQPQLEDFKADVLTGRAAISVKNPAWKEPVFGAVWLSGRVLTDRDTRMATITEVKVTAARFPQAKPEQVEKLKTFLNEEMQNWSIPIGLDRLLADLEVLETAQ